MTQLESSGFRTSAGSFGIFYGWIIVLAVFFTAAAAAGIMFAFAAFFESFEAEFGASRSEISFVFAISGFIWFVTGFAAGFLADRFGPRAIGIVGTLLMAGGLALAASSTSIQTLYVAYGIGVGAGGGMIYVPAVSTVQRWFKRKRGLASGLASCGNGVGTLTFPVVAMLLANATGWRGAHYILALCALIICGTASLLLIAAPRDVGLAPDGDSPVDIAGTAAPLPGLTLRQTLGMGCFWQLYAASLLSAAGVYISYVHLVPFATDNGISAQSAITLVGILGISGTFARFLLGALADYVGRRNALSLMFAGLAVSMLWWLLAPPTFTTLVAYAVVFGMFYGGYITILPALAMEYFGGWRISTIIGALYTSWAGGALCGPTLAGAIHDQTGGYFYAILMGALFMAISTVSCLTIREPRTQY